MNLEISRFIYFANAKERKRERKKREKRERGGEKKKKKECGTRLTGVQKKAVPFGRTCRAFRGRDTDKFLGTGLPFRLRKTKRKRAEGVASRGGGERPGHISLGGESFVAESLFFSSRVWP